MVAGNLNVKLSEPERNRRGEGIAVALTTAGPEEISAHFLLLQIPWRQDRRTRSMVEEGEEVRSRTGYTLGMDRHFFWNVSVRDPRHNLDHYLVLGCLHSAPPKGEISVTREAQAAPPPSIDVIPSVSFFCATTDSSFYFLLASASHHLMCLSLIPEGPLEQ